MKKQKKPIILVLVLAALFGYAAIMNKPQPTAAEQQKQAQEAQPEKKDDVASGVVNAVKDAKPAAPPKMKHHPGMPGGDGPSVLKPPMVNYKPKPNDSATSTQWYLPESARNK